MKSFFKTKYGPLIFSLLSGVAYFVLAFMLILDSEGGNGALLGFFFCPAIVCGAALVLLKSIRLWLEGENYRKVYMIATVHCIVILAAIATVILKVVSGM